MMTIISLYALLSVLVVSLISLVGVFTLSLRPRLLEQGVFVLVSLAAGALFGDALIHLIPASFAEIGDSAIAALFVVAGILVFFALEKFLHWHHVHGIDEVEHGHEETLRVRPLGRLILVSDGLHNFIDGIIIGVAYFISIEVGIATTIAIILHEIPQEIGDFGVLLHAGFKKGKALLMNFATALVAIAGTLLALLMHEVGEQTIPYITAFAAGSFLYIAGSDLVPEMHKSVRPRQAFFQFVAMLIGVALMFALIFTEVPRGHEDEHSAAPDIHEKSEDYTH